MDLEKTIEDALIVSIEAMFELDLFDFASQKAFEDLFVDE